MPTPTKITSNKRIQNGFYNISFAEYNETTNTYEIPEGFEHLWGVSLNIEETAINVTGKAEGAVYVNGVDVLGAIATLNGKNIPELIKTKYAGQVKTTDGFIVTPTVRKVPKFALIFEQDIRGFAANKIGGVRICLPICSFTQVPRNPVNEDVSNAADIPFVITSEIVTSPDGSATDYMYSIQQFDETTGALQAGWADFYTNIGLPNATPAEGASGASTPLMAAALASENAMQLATKAQQIREDLEKATKVLALAEAEAEKAKKEEEKAVKAALPKS